MNDKAQAAAQEAPAGEDDVTTNEAAMWAEMQDEDDAKAAPPSPGRNDDADDAADYAAQDAADEGLPAEEAGNDPNGADPQPGEDDAEVQRLKRESDLIEQRMRSDAGRHAAHQRRLQELMNAARPEPEPAKRKSVEDILKPIANEYPEFTGPLKEALNEIDSRTEQLSANERGRREAAQRELNDLVADQTRTLEQSHPDYISVLKNNGPEFTKWVEDQPKALREAAYRNGNAIVDAVEADRVLHAFKKHLGIIKDEPAPIPETKTPISDKRMRQMDGASAPNRTTRRPTVSGIPEDGDPQAIWDSFEELENGR